MRVLESFDAATKREETAQTAAQAAATAATAATAAGVCDVGGVVVCKRAKFHKYKSSPKASRSPGAPREVPTVCTLKGEDPMGAPRVKVKAELLQQEKHSEGPPATAAAAAVAKGVKRNRSSLQVKDEVYRHPPRSPAALLLQLQQQQHKHQLLLLLLGDEGDGPAVYVHSTTPSDSCNALLAPQRGPRGPPSTVALASAEATAATAAAAAAASAETHLARRSDLTPQASKKTKVRSLGFRV